MVPGEQRKIVQTKDGSNTLHHIELDEHYHSVHGALQESEHVFIKHGLQPMFEVKSSLRIMEVGFGTGLNAYLTLRYASQHKMRVEYLGLEPFPLSLRELEGLRYEGLFSLSEQVDRFDSLHGLEWNERHITSAGHGFTKLKTTLELFDGNYGVDLIYYDAFGPRVQPELWTEEMMAKAYHCLLPEGVLVTYCAKGSVKRAMKSAGFVLEALPGPPGKREMTRATRPNR
jgi:tRNA U34 5-methylaminomethyl-2-thiouridine-forming methyltransferase MnmC